MTSSRSMPSYLQYKILKILSTYYECLIASIFALFLFTFYLALFPYLFFIAPIEAASFCGASRSKRYSGKREIAPKKTKKPRKNRAVY